MTRNTQKQQIVSVKNETDKSVIYEKKIPSFDVVKITLDTMLHLFNSWNYNLDLPGLSANKPGSHSQELNWKWNSETLTCILWICSGRCWAFHIQWCCCILKGRSHNPATHNKSSLNKAQGWTFILMLKRFFACPQHWSGKGENVQQSLLFLLVLCLSEMLFSSRSHSLPQLPYPALAA